MEKQEMKNEEKGKNLEKISNTNHNNLTFKEFSNIIEGTILKNDLDYEVKKICIDSRKLIISENSIFFAIQGKNFDSHKILEYIYKLGIRQFIIEKNINFKFFVNNKANIIRVKNSIKAFQKFASYIRNKNKMPILGITGSYAKTIIKEWLSESLSNSYNLIKNPKSFNSQIGVPLSVSQIEKTHEYGIFEAGISEENEMQNLFEVINPTLGIFTNIGSAHELGFKSIEEKIFEKSKLFQNCKKIFYCKNYGLIDDILKKHYEKHRLVSWSFTKNMELEHSNMDSDNNFPDLYLAKNYFVSYSIDKNFTIINIHNTNKNSKIIFKTHFKDIIHIENLIHCVIFLLHEIKDASLIKKYIKKFHPLDMRLSLKKGTNNCQIINDAYINDYESLRAALNFMDEQANVFNNFSSQHIRNKIVITSDFAGVKNNNSLYQNVYKLFKEHKILKIIAVGTDFYKFRNFFKNLNIDFYKNTEEFLDSKNCKFQDSIILIKGSREYKFEKIVSYLELKKNAAALEIDFNGIIHNLNFFKAILKENTKLMVMVKALSYGSSEFEIPKLLEFHNIDYLTVAYTDEGIKLRNNGIKLPILVLHPTQNCFDLLTKYHLEPEIYSIKFLKQYIEYVNGHKFGVNKFCIHIKIDSGMHRLGIQKNEIHELIDLLIKNNHINVKSIFSHLAASADSCHDGYTLLQLRTFEEIYTEITKKIDYMPLKHILNSNGILRFSKFQYDMVRLGIGLYGIGIKKPWSEDLIPVATLYSYILQIKHLPKNSSVGYNRGYILKKDTKIAIISIGYADGLNKKFENCEVFIKNNPAKILHICMDVAIIDITNIKDISENEKVIIFDKHNSIDKLSRRTDIIPYEILSQISRRVRRVYVLE